MLESTFLEDWDEIGTKMAKKGHLLPKSGINSELVSIQRVKFHFYSHSVFQLSVISVLYISVKFETLSFLYVQQLGKRSSFRSA